MPDVFGDSVLEAAMRRAKAGLLTPQVLMWTLAASRLVAPTSNADYDGDLAHFVPLLIGRDGLTFMVVFTNPARMGRFAERGPQFIELTGAQLVSMMPPGCGLAVNPESDLGFELPADGLAALKDELSH